MITKKVLSENPILLAFLSRCKLREDYKNDEQTFLVTPDMDEFLSFLPELEKFLFFFKDRFSNLKGGAVAKGSLYELTEEIDKAATEAKKKQMDNIIKGIESKLGLKSHLVQFKKGINNFIIFHKDTEIVNVPIVLEVFQEEATQATFENIAKFVELYLKSQKLADKCKALKLFIGYNKVSLHCYDLDVSFDIRKMDSYKTASNDLQKMEANIDRLNHAYEEIKNAYKEIDSSVNSISVGFEEYVVWLNFSIGKYTSHITGPHRNAKSDVHRIKQCMENAKRA